MSYMSVVEGKYGMKSGANSDTLFGLIGQTKGHTKIQSLGGIVDGGKPSAPKPSGLKKGKVAVETDHHLGGKNATKVPGAHSGMVPFAGPFMTHVGKKL